jgi:hypothetical protein
MDVCMQVHVRIVCTVCVLCAQVKSFLFLCVCLYAQVLWLCVYVCIVCVCVCMRVVYVLQSLQRQLIIETYICICMYG